MNNMKQNIACNYVYMYGIDKTIYVDWRWWLKKEIIIFIDTFVN